MEKDNIYNNDNISNLISEVFKDYPNNNKIYYIYKISHINCLIENLIENNNLNSSSIIKILNVLYESFSLNSLNIILFKKNIKKNIYLVFIDLYLNNKYNENKIEILCLNIIDCLINNIDISKEIIDYIIKKFSVFFHNKEIKFPSYEELRKNLEILKHLYGVNLTLNQPYNYFYLNGNSYISLPINNINELSIRLSFKPEKIEKKNFDIISFIFNNNYILTISIIDNLTLKLFFSNEEEIIKTNLDKIFEWNQLTLSYKIEENSIIISFYLNNNLLLFEQNYHLENNNSEITLNSILLGNNFYGKITSILIFKKLIPYEFHKLINNKYIYGFSKSKEINTFFNKQGREYLSQIIYLFSPISLQYNYLNNNKNNKLIFGENCSYHIFHCYQKKLSLIGGINIILPIIELLYLNINICIQHNDLILSFFELVLIIISFKKKNMEDAFSNKFLLIFSVFLERFPKTIFSDIILKIIIDIAKNLFVFSEKSPLYQYYFQYILYNDKIIKKYNPLIINDFWEHVLKFYEGSKSYFIPINKIIFALYINDKCFWKEKKICCEEHLNSFSDKNKFKVMNPAFKIRNENLIRLLELIIEDRIDNVENNFKKVVNLLSLNISPCLINYILELSNKFLRKRRNNEIIYNIFNSKEYKIILMNLIKNDFPDVKYNTIKFILSLFKYNRTFQFSLFYIKQNIFPLKDNEFHNLDLNNYYPTEEDIKELALHLIKKNSNYISTKCYNHDQILSISIFSDKYISVYYTKIIECLVYFIEFIPQKISLVLDIIIEICDKLNIENLNSLFTHIRLLILSNKMFLKKIIFYIPLLHYIIDILIFYFNYTTSTFNSSIQFINEMINELDDYNDKFNLISIILTYCSNLKNIESKSLNLTINVRISFIINKIFSNLIEECFKNEPDVEFFSILISMIFDYFTVFNQDKNILEIYETGNMNIILPTFSEKNITFINIFLKGLNLYEGISSKKYLKLNELWLDYNLANLIIDYFLKKMNVEKYLKKDISNLKMIDKCKIIFEKIILSNDENISNNFIKMINLLKYSKDTTQYYPIIKILSHLFMIELTLSKEEKEFIEIVNKYKIFLEYILLISCSLNEKDFGIIFTNELINLFLMIFGIGISFLVELTESKDSKNKSCIALINCINELLCICLLISQYIQDSKKKFLKNIFSKNSKKFLYKTMPYKFIDYFLLVDSSMNENKLSEKQKENRLEALLEENDNFDKFYSIIINKNYRDNFSGLNKFISDKYPLFVNYGVFLNLAKKRLDKIDFEICHMNDIEGDIIEYNKINDEIAVIRNLILNSIFNSLKLNYNNFRERRNHYKVLKKKLFSWNFPWSNFDLFYNNQNKMKFKLLNHFTKKFSHPFLIPILDFDFYFPNFSHFTIDKLFNENESEFPYKKLIIDVDKILNNNAKNDKTYKYVIFPKEEKENKKNECCLVKLTHHIKGYFDVKDKGIEFKVIINEKTIKKEKIDYNVLEEDDNYDNIRHTCHGSYFISHNKDKDNLNYFFPFSQIKMILKRIYYYKETALEIYFKNNKSYYFNFKEHEIRELSYNKIIENIRNKIEIFCGENSNFILNNLGITIDKNFTIGKIIENWKEYKISNSTLLMYLNILSGRSFNDLSQYPVYPWILIDYSSKNLTEEDLNLKNSIYRDLTCPMGMLECLDNGERKKIYIKIYKTLLKEYKQNENKNKIGIEFEEKPYVFGSHYSNPIYVCHFLTRIFPYSNLMIELQGNKFDDPDRLFISVNNSFNGATTQKGDLRELIPEFYYIPEMFLNINNLNLGIRRNKSKVNNVICPIWSNDDPYKMITLLFFAFESFFVSEKINNWIDLVFGYKQRGEEAEKCYNIFMNSTYPDEINIEKYDKNKKMYYFRSVEFGITPKQIFFKKFPSKSDINHVFQFKQISNFEKENLKVLKIEFDEKEEKENKKIVIMKVINNEEFIIIWDNESGIRVKVFSNKDNTTSFNDKEFEFGSKLLKNEILLNFIKYEGYNPILIYNNGNNIVEAGYLDGKLILTNLENEKNIEPLIIYNPSDKSPIINVSINEDENFALLSNILGIIHIYDVNKNIWNFKFNLIIHNKIINDIFISNDMNVFISSSKDNFVNIITIPSCKLIRSFYVKKPKFSFLSECPLPVSLIYSEESEEFIIYSVNGHLINRIKESGFDDIPIFFSDYKFCDYIIYLKNCSLILRSFPYLDVVYNITLYYDVVYHFKMDISPNKNSLFLLDENSKYILKLKDNNNNSKLKN